jgi:hypothetical protein
VVSPGALRALRALGLVACGALALHGCGSTRHEFGDQTPPAGDAGDAGSGSFPDGTTNGACVPDPANFDVPGNGCDDDGNGAVDDTPSCDANLPMFGGSADDIAKAIGICAKAQGTGWGVVSATLTRGHASSITTPPAAGQQSIVPAFGKVVRAREGKNLAVLSTGWARPYDDVEATSCDSASLTHCFKQGVQMQSGLPIAGGAPDGWPRSVAGCPTSDQVFDVVDVKLAIKVPKNARGFSIDFDFWSGEWPDYVCTPYNDAFLIYLQSAAFNGGVPDNVAFDAARGAVSVNNAFFDRCSVGTQTGCRGVPPLLKTSSCSGNVSELEETGFYASGLYCNAQLSTGGGATGWLTAQAPAQAGEVMTVELLIWDTGDPKFDSTVLVDRFAWQAVASETSTFRPK